MSNEPVEHGPPNERDRPTGTVSPASTPISTEGSVTRSAIEALLSTLSLEQKPPRWFTHPATEAQFAASLLAHCPQAQAVYGPDDVLIAYRGIRLRREAA